MKLLETTDDIQALLAWARSRPADETYEYCSRGHCAISQYLKYANPGVQVSVSPVDYTVGNVNKPLHEMLDNAALGVDRPTGERHRTFSAFALRLEQVLASGEFA